MAMIHLGVCLPVGAPELAAQSTPPRRSAPPAARTACTNRICRGSNRIGFSCKPCHNPLLTSLASLAASMLTSSTPMPDGGAGLVAVLGRLVLGGVEGEGLHHVGTGAEELVVQLADRLGVLHRRLRGPGSGLGEGEGGREGGRRASTLT